MNGANIERFCFHLKATQWPAALRIGRIQYVESPYSHYSFFAFRLFVWCALVEYYIPEMHLSFKLSLAELQVHRRLAWDNFRFSDVIKWPQQQSEEGRTCSIYNSLDHVPSKIIIYVKWCEKDFQWHYFLISLFLSGVSVSVSASSYVWLYYLNRESFVFLSFYA